MESKQILPDVLQNKTNLIPGTFSSKMSGGADTRPEPLRYGFGGESVSPGKAIFMGGKRRTRRHNNKRRGGKRSTGKRSTGKRRGGTSMRNKNIMRGGRLEPVNLRIGEKIYTFYFSQHLNSLMLLPTDNADKNLEAGLYMIPPDWRDYYHSGKSKHNNRADIDYIQRLRVSEQGQETFYNMFKTKIHPEMLNASLSHGLASTHKFVFDKEELEILDTFSKSDIVDLDEQILNIFAPRGQSYFDEDKDK
jgi:hypothetical protein